jgi:hypothetical protein
MRASHPPEIQISSFELNIIRDLKRIEAKISAIGHGVLEQQGQLRESGRDKPCGPYSATFDSPT